MSLFSKLASSKSTILGTCLFLTINGFGTFFLYQSYQWLGEQEKQFSEYASNLALSISSTLPESRTNGELQQLATKLLTVGNIDAVFFSDGNGQIIAHAGQQAIIPNILTKQNQTSVTLAHIEQRLYASAPVQQINSSRQVNPDQATNTVQRIIIAVDATAAIRQQNQLILIFTLSFALIIIANYLIFRWLYVSRKLSHSVEPTQQLQQKFEASHQQLRQSIAVQKRAAEKIQQEALKTSELKSQFIANMSHEIRTPLNAIVGFTDLLLKTELTQRQQNFLGNIKQSSHGLLQIINDILDFSKMEAGKVNLELQPVNLRTIIEDALVQLAPAAHQKQLELIPIVYPDTPDCILADPKRLGQILTNLISNAIKFTHHGSIVVRANTEQSTSKTPEIKVSVTDTGIGISSEQQEQLFTAFTQADTSSTRHYEGTGLGLVIAKQLSEQMHGSIGVKSRLHHGSSFWFTFKAKRLPSPPPLNIDALLNKKIFIYDSYPLSRLSLQNTLNQWGIDVSSTNHLEQLEAFVAERKSPSDPPAIIVNMGFSTQKNLSINLLIRRLKKQYQCPTIVLYNATLEHDEAVISQAYRALTKPVRYEALYQVINELVASPDGVPEYSIHEQHSDDVLSYEPSVLVVDDNAANLKLAEALFLEIGASVKCATSGQQALELLSQFPFDAVFMDIQMPEMDGVETTQIIRSRPSAYRDIPIIALTAYALEKEKEQWLTCGFDEYLTKPVTESQLLEALLRWTDVQVQAPSSLQAIRTENAVDTNRLDDIVDIELGIRLAGGKPDLAKELFEMLVENLGKDADAIKSAAGLPNNDHLFQHVHYLHGATRYCGVPALQQATERLEISIKKNDEGDLGPALEALLSEINRVRVWAKNNQWASPQAGQ